jgi:ubiquitin conjugation factor E4 B
MIEKRFKSEYDSSYKQIRKVIANYITLLINCPENFDVQISKKEIYTQLKKYLQETDEEELGYFLMDLYHSVNSDASSLSTVFAYLFNIIHEQNTSVENRPHFFNMDKLRKNMMLLASLFDKCPQLAEAYVQEANFNPKLMNSNSVLMNGKNFQLQSYLGPYLTIATFEADVNSLRNNFPINKSNQEVDSIIKSYTNKLNDYLNDFTYFIYTIYSSTEASRNGLLNWAYSLISLNFDRTKMWQNSQNSSSIGMLLNCLIVLLKILFDIQSHLKINYSDFIFKVVAQIDPLFTLSNNKINFSKFDRINPDLVKEIIENEGDESNYKEYNLYTQLFFIISTISSLTIKSFDDEIQFISNKFEELYNENKTSDPIFKDYNSILKSACCYLRNSEFCKNLLKFGEISSVFVFSLNNKKYPQINLDKQTIDYHVYIEEFFQFIDNNDNFALSLLPMFVCKNIFQNCLFIRKHNSDTLVNEMNSTKIIVYYAIIYSSQLDLIKNPHLRSEIFDVLIYIFVIHNFEKNNKISSVSKLLKEEFVKNSLIISVMRVFIDAERLGTSNQFYEKFSIRHKILYLIENIMKANKQLFTQKIIDYANEYKEDCTKMINLLMNDLTFLNDECIERLMDIKRYQDLRDDVSSWRIF